MVSEQLVRLKLAQEAEEEEPELDADMEGSSMDDHPSVVILNGLRLEDDQCVYCFLCLWLAAEKNSLGGDFLRISKLWGYIQRPSRLLH